MALPIGKYLGGKEFKKFLEGEKLSFFQAIKAKCFECCGNYVDGTHDCEIKTCPLYPFHPYNKNRIKTRHGPSLAVVENLKRKKVSE